MLQGIAVNGDKAGALVSPENIDISGRSARVASVPDTMEVVGLSKTIEACLNGNNRKESEIHTSRKH